MVLEWLAGIALAVPVACIIALIPMTAWETRENKRLVRLALEKAESLPPEEGDRLLRRVLLAQTSFNYLYMPEYWTATGQTMPPYYKSRAL